MKRSICIASLACIIYAFACGAPGPTVFHVSPDGSDSNPGTESQPFATLERARDEIRSLKAREVFPAIGFTVLVHDGTYNRVSSFVLSEEDSGLENAPVVWRAAGDGEVCIIGGSVLTGFKPATESGIGGRIDGSLIGNVLQTNLSALGISDFQSMDIELFQEGSYLTLARWPNEGWTHIATVPQFGDSLMHPGLDRDQGRRAIPRGRHYGRFSYEDDRPNRWGKSNDIWMKGYWTWDWAYGTQKVERFDKDKQLIYPARPYHHYGYVAGQRFFFFNILEELDSSGEWYLDRETGMLYVWPLKPIDEADISIALLGEPVFSLDNTANVRIEGFTIATCQNMGIYGKNCTDTVIGGCTFTNLGGTAVRLDDAAKCTIAGCDISYVSYNGIQLSGGDRKTLTPGNNLISNNHVHHYSRRAPANTIGISSSGVGNRLAHNCIHDAPHHALSCRGNDNIVEYNEIYDVILETGDAGAIHIGRTWTERGNIFRHNYFHDINGPGGLAEHSFTAAVAMYLDDTYSGVEVSGNIFHNVSMAFLLGGGHDNTFENNVMVDCRLSMHIDSRGKGWAEYLIVPGGQWHMYEKLDEVNYDQPPYSMKYPKLAKILKSSDPHLATGNMIARNVSWGHQWLQLLNGLDFQIVNMSDNLISNDIIATWDRNDGKGLVTYERGDPEITMLLEGYGNKFVEGNPGFIDPEHDDFSLSTDSPAWDMGFKELPQASEMGLKIGEYRTELP